jgi:hypothetical protein
MPKKKPAKKKRVAADKTKTLRYCDEQMLDLIQSLEATLLSLLEQCENKEAKSLTGAALAKVRKALNPPITPTTDKVTISGAEFDLLYKEAGLV